MDKIKIRLAKPKDVSSILKVQKNGWLATYISKEYGITKEDILCKKLDSKERQKGWENAITKNKKTSRFWIAECDQKIVGYCTAKKDNNFNKLTLYLLPRFQSQGTGSKFIKKIFNWLGNDKKIKIQVISYNTKAINFYKKHGFRKISKKDYKLPNGKIMPGIIMIK